MSDATRTEARRPDADEALTDELLARLLEATSPEAYLDRAAIDDRDLAGYLGHLLEERGMRRSEVIRASGVNPTFCYQIFAGRRHAGRDTAIMLAFGLRCTLAETQRLLRHAGASELWCKRRRDAVIIFCVEHGMTRQQCDDELYRLGEPTLLGSD